MRRELHRCLFSPAPWVGEAVVEGVIVVRVAQGSRIKIGFSSLPFTQILAYNGKQHLTSFPSTTHVSLDVVSTKSATSSWSHSSPTFWGGEDYIDMYQLCRYRGEESNPLFELPNGCPGKNRSTPPLLCYFRKFATKKTQLQPHATTILEQTLLPTSDTSISKINLLLPHHAYISLHHHRPCCWHCTRLSRSAQIYERHSTHVSATN